MAGVPKLYLLFLLCSSAHSLFAHARDVHSYKVLTTGSLKPDAVDCSKPKVTSSSSSGAATVSLHHRHGPCSPAVPSSTEKPTLEELLRSDRLRASYIQRRLSGAIGSEAAGGGVEQSKAAATVPTTLGASLGTPEYVITVGVGSPAVAQTVLIDTGSDVSWVRCKPCPQQQCHPQADPLFDPAASGTYAAFPCGSAACAGLGREGNGCSSAQQCQYRVRYGDRSNTTGTYGSDTLALGSAAVVRSFQFGCSHVEFEFDDRTAGLMGLGGGAQSLVSQTAATFGAAFSYCLPPQPGSAGFLTLGASGGAGGGFVTTPMLRSSRVPTFYLVVLEAIAVGGEKLAVDASVFSGGAVMDSGTVVTWLPPTAYSALSSAFRAGMKRLQYPVAPGRGALDTCFDFTGHTNVTVPAVSLVFAGGAVVDLDFSGILSGSCLAFAANDDDRAAGIIGNVQQRTFEVLYDVGRSSVGFRAGAC